MTLYVCQICGKYASPQFDPVLRHIGAVHSHDAGFNVFCGIEQCPRSFKNYHSWRRHIRDKHPFMLPSRSTLPVAPSDIAETSDQQLPGNSAEVQDEDDDQHDHEQLDQPSLSETDGAGLSCRGVDEDDIHKRVEAIHILKFKERYKLSQTTVDNIISDVGEITTNIVSRLHERVADLLAQKQVPLDDEIKELFSDTSLRPFEKLKTEHKQVQYFRKHLGLVVS